MRTQWCVYVDTARHARFAATTTLVAELLELWYPDDVKIIHRGLGLDEARALALALNQGLRNAEEVTEDALQHIPDERQVEGDVQGLPL